MKQNYHILRGILYHYEGQVVTEQRLQELFTLKGILLLKSQKYIENTFIEAFDDYKPNIGCVAVLSEKVYLTKRKIPFIRLGGAISNEKLLELFSAKVIKDLIDYEFIIPLRKDDDN